MDSRSEQLSVVMKNTSDAMWLVDADLRTVEINPVACQLMGCRAGAVIGKQFESVWKNDKTSGHQRIGEYLSAAMERRKDISFEVGMTLVSAYGQSCVIDGAAHPLFSNEEIAGAIAIFKPVSVDRSIEKLQADFVAMASHNLRTPLMSIQVALDYVLQGKADQTKSQELLIEARQQGQNIAVFLRKLLDISQLALISESSLDMQPIEINRLLTLVMTQFEKQSAGIICQLDIPTNLPRVQVDQEKVTFVLQHLLEYACGRSKSGDVLRVSAKDSSEVVAISIVDQGPPVSDQQKQRMLWHIFPLEENDETGYMPYSYEIGLYSAQRLVEALGGQLWISQPDNGDVNKRGVSYNFTLPVWR